MQQAEFETLFDQTVEDCRKLLVIKGGEYAGGSDRFSNFKRGAGLTGTHHLQVALIYMSKHYDSLCTYVRDTASGTNRPRSESILGRCDDLINYAVLMKGMIQELEEAAGNERV